jgi:hypothetical protein
LAIEEGPANAIVRLRESLANTILASFINCFGCLSVWIAIPFAFFVSAVPVDWIVTWVALSGAAFLLERMARSRSSLNGFPIQSQESREMGCCGQRRVFPGGPPAVQGSAAKPVPPRPQFRVPAAVTGSAGVTAPLRYAKPGGIAVRGPVTGKHYAFTVAAPVKQVDAKDLAGLLRTSWFQRA